MMFLPLLMAAPIAAHAANAAYSCPPAREKRAHVQWSHARTVVAPNRAWAVEVRPVLTADENISPLVLYRCGGKPIVTVMRLSRSADLVWSDDANTLLVIDQAGAESFTVRLFRIGMAGGNVFASERPNVDKGIRTALVQRLGGRAAVQFFEPVFVAWKGDQLTLGIQGTLSEREPGPMKSYCFTAQVHTADAPARSVYPLTLTMGNRASCKGR
ncbi:MAG: hypothetical protein ABIW83_02285 [Allosphingosinicella sp.]